MAITVIDLVGPPTGSRLLKDDSAGGSPAENVAANKKLRHVYVDNSLNNVPVYVKFYDAASVTVGTTDPVMIIPVPASSEKTVTFQSDVYTFANLSWAVTTEAGTGGTTSPASAVKLEVLVHD